MSQELKKSLEQSNDCIPFTFIDSKNDLDQLCSLLKKESLLAIDLEMENNLHHYGAYISIIQISSKNGNWIIDALAIKDLSPIWDIFENHSIEKIFHDVSFDFRILNTEYSCKPKNIFDSELASVLLGKESVGLQSLLSEYFDVKKESKFQMADWTKRPLKSSMLEYAIKDTLYLIPLREKLLSEIVSMGRLAWLKESLKDIEQQNFELKHPGFYDLKGLRQFTKEELGILKELFDLRESLAKKVNRPVHFILNNKRLKELAKNPPTSVKTWASMKGVHPILRAQAKNFFSAVIRGKKNPIIITKEPVKKFSAKQKSQLEILTSVRDHLENKHSLKAHIFLTKDNMIRIIINSSFDSLLSWQQDEVKKALSELDLILF
jgi:ribonuclease D